ncbi:hypothetical protein [Paenibacillus terrigena]|uniref:hypothetical protein n=1 Tax=Paenibacillus terrigena TaxID=369333 RepID=UPI00036D12CF|nr:hypothetical protein [Paenibacillus terrigena]
MKNPKKVSLMLLVILFSLSLIPNELKASKVEYSQQINGKTETCTVDLSKCINIGKGKSGEEATEIVSKRTSNSKQYRLSNGHSRKTYSSMPMHYLDNNGNFLDINTSLLDTNDLLTSDIVMSSETAVNIKKIKSNQMKNTKKDSAVNTYTAAQVPFYLEVSKSVKKGYLIGKDNIQLTFIPIGATDVIGSVDRDKISYQDVWKDSDIQLKVLPNGIKEDIILKSINAPRKFSFQVKGQLSDRLVSGKMKIAPAFLIDANGIKRDVKQLLRNENEGLLYIDLEFDTTGLTYPITVDPSVTIDGGIYKPGTSNKVYVDFPDLNVNQIQQMYVESYLGDNDPEMLFQPVEIYLTKEEYGNEANFGYTSPKPGKDGRNVIYVGSTQKGILNVRGQDLRSLWSGVIYGAAAYSPNLAAATEYATIDYTIDYVDSPIDNQAPTAPTNFAISSTLTTLSWSGSTDNFGVEWYHIYNGTQFVIASVPGNTNSYPVNLLPNNNLYKLSVKAYDADGNESNPSNVITFYKGELKYNYDQSGRLSNVTTPSGQVLKIYQYDKNGNLLKIITP